MSIGIYNQHTGYHNRKSIRLPGFDYSQPGYYFVTVCIHDRTQRLFGDVVNAEMIENEYGGIVRNELMLTEQMRPNIKIDTCVIMPNHIHVIFGVGVGAYCNTPQHTPQHTPKHTSKHVQSTRKTTFASPSGTIGAIVRGIKSTSTKQINLLRNSPGIPVWQRNYYERIVRDEKALFAIRNYIRKNPVNWFNDSKIHIEREICKFEMKETGGA